MTSLPPCTLFEANSCDNACALGHLANSETYEALAMEKHVTRVAVVSPDGRKLSLQLLRFSVGASTVASLRVRYQLFDILLCCLQHEICRVSSGASV